MWFIFAYKGERKDTHPQTELIRKYHNTSKSLVFFFPRAKFLSVVPILIYHHDHLEYSWLHSLY